ncbi:MAG: transglycosylase domain-containing protein [Dehalococcoidia bacterium]|nr:transglycosylase domain-containing protein [Dehalococcoidia bacterium]
MLIALVSMAALGAIGVAASLGTVYAVYQSYAEDYVPIEDRLRQTAIGLTGVYDRGGPEDGEFLGYLPNPDAQLLDPVPFEDISPWMVEATIATEDNSFWDHPGVNIRGLVRAAYENYVINEFGEGTGGSSITQQLIKNVYICPQIGDEAERCEVAERTVDRKLQEIAFAMELERDYSKEEILGLGTQRDLLRQPVHRRRRRGRWLLPQGSLRAHHRRVRPPGRHPVCADPLPSPPELRHRGGHGQLHRRCPGAHHRRGRRQGAAGRRHRPDGRNRPHHGAAGRRCQGRRGQGLPGYQRREGEPLRLQPGSPLPRAPM